MIDPDPLILPDPEKLLGIRVLIADDSSDVQRLLSFILKRIGAQVDCADNGEQAVEQIQKHPYDIVLMDMEMPILDGCEATVALRRQGFDKPIIALTAHSMLEDREKWLACGCNEWVVKPFSIPNLVKLIQRHAVK